MKAINKNGKRGSVKFEHLLFFLIILLQKCFGCLTLLHNRRSAQAVCYAEAQ